MLLNIFEFNLPFQRPLTTAKGVYSSRVGLLLEVTIDNNRFWSEVSPLPGFSITSISDCKKWLSLYKDDFIRCLLSTCSYLKYCSTLGEIIVQVQQHAEIHSNEIISNAPSEIKFAFDVLLFQMISSKSTIKVDSTIPIKVNATANSLESARNLINNGYKAIKLKVGLAWNHELSIIENLRMDYPDMCIRLDANEAWSAKTAFRNLPDLIKYDIDYIEQPVSVADLVTYGRELCSLGIRIAADESARSADMIRVLLDSMAADVFILKPPMIGNFDSIKSICDLIHQCNGRVVFTSSLDSALNVSMAALLAHLWTKKDEYHGFSTGAMLDYDLNHSPTRISDSNFYLDSAWILKPDNTLNKNLLTPL